ncbi:MAG TPA: PKD domain-containing protein [Anaerolineae bacterium]|nr:PKD domain-containing protein [Anaerolineae bacterium]HQI84178.1 PKD domain-containing protein [Anaerolineae bacterium]
MQTSKLVRVVLIFGVALTLLSVGRSPAGSVSVQAQSLAAPPEPYTWKNVEIVGGGFVPGIIFNTTEPGLVYARTDIGGAYRLDTATNRWIPLLDWIGWDQWGWTGIDSLATDPVDPDRVYAFAGTYTNGWDPGNAAILRSADRGATWEISELPFKGGGNMPGRAMGERLAIDPNSNNILYLGTRSGNGLWRSTDYGATWAKVNSFTAVGNYAPGTGEYEGDLIGVVWVIFDAESGTATMPTPNIYVGVADTETALYRSADGGQTWEPVPGQPQQGYLPYHGVLASNGVLYITYSDNCGPYGGNAGAVWKYNTGTGVWTNITPPPPGGGEPYGYGGLTVDASDPDVVMVSTQESWWPDDIIFRSTDGGATWKWIWEIRWVGWPPPRTNHYVQDISGAPWLNWGRGMYDNFPELSPKLGWMIGDLEIDPFNPDRMLYVTGATIYGSDNLTDWDADELVTITVKAQGLEETAALDLISPPTGATRLISALGDIGGFRHDDLTVVPPGMTTNPVFASGTGLDYAELDPKFVVRVGDGDDIKNLSYSVDGGFTWTAAVTEPVGLNRGGNVAVAADGSAIVWSPGPTVVYSLNNGNSWIPSAGVPAGATVESDRVNPDTFYAYAGGSFYRSADGGATFVAVVNAGWPPTATAKFKAVPGIEGDIWLAGGNDDTVYGLWHSTNGGDSFTRLANVEKADVVGFGAPAPGADYMAIYISGQVAGVRGIYRSTDMGASWVRINDDQHQYAWTGAAITGDPRIYGRVYVSTNGRGVIYGDPQASPPPTYTLTINIVGQGTVTCIPDLTAYYAGDVVELIATPAPGWQFDGWSGATLLENPTRVEIYANTVLTATFTWVNQAPTANAGPDQKVAPRAHVTLDGSASFDPEGGALAYRWRQIGGPAVTFTPELSRTTFVASQASTVLTFTLTVTDTGGLSDADEVVITVDKYRIYLPLVLRNFQG